MIHDEDLGGKSRLVTSPWMLAVAMAVILSMVSFVAPMGKDEGMWSYIGRIWVENGTPPYVGAVENKTPGIFELFAISHLVFGTTALPMRSVGVVAIVATSVFLFLIARQMADALAGKITMITFGLAMAWLLMDGPLTAQTETFMVCFSSLSVLLLIRALAIPNGGFGTRVFFCGLALGLSIHFKQIAVLSAVGWLCILLLACNVTSRQKLIATLLASFGIGLSLSLAAIPLFATGVGFWDYVEGAWLILLNKGSSKMVTFDSGDTLEFLVRWVHLRLTGFLSVWTSTRVVLFYPFLLLLAFDRGLLRNRLFLGVVGWGIADFLGVNASGHYFGHQLKQALPALTIIVGILTSRHIRRVRAGPVEREKRLILLLVLVIILWFPYAAVYTAVIHVVKDGTGDCGRELGTWIRENSNPRDHIYIIGREGPSALAYSERIAPSKYFSTIFLNDEDAKRTFLTDLQDRPPVFFLMETNSEGGSLPWIVEYVRENYRPTEIVYGYTVFVRKNESNRDTNG